MNEKEIPDGARNTRPADATGKQKAASTADMINDGLFTIKLNDDMTLRNALRAGLVEAQGKDTDKIPMFVSWPPWLEDGVVCLFAKDFHGVLRKVMRDTADVARQDLDVDVKAAELGNAPEPVKAAFEPVSFPKIGVSQGEKKQPVKPVETAREKGPAPAHSEEPPPDPVSDDQALADKLFSQIRKELGK